MNRRTTSILVFAFEIALILFAAGISQDLAPLPHKGLNQTEI